MHVRAIALGLILGLGAGACAPQEVRDFEVAKEQIQEGHFRSALTTIDHIIKRAPDSESALKSAREGARLAVLEIKDYRRAVGYLQFIVVHSSEQKERVNAQKQMAGIYFDQLQDYEKAIVELNKLVTESETDVEIANYKLDIARANYYKNNFFQAQSELDDVLKRNINDNERFSAKVLKANIYIAQKEYSKAIDILKDVIATQPQKALQENVYQTLAVCYEESGSFKEAINLLESVKDKLPQPDYVVLRIKRLLEREKNRPGARGLRK